MATLNDVFVSARELSFDRFVTPTFFIQGSADKKLSITSEYLRIHDNTVTTDKIISELEQEESTTQPRIVKVIPSNVTSGKDYSIELGGIVLTFTSTANTVADVTAGLTAAILAEQIANPTGPWTKVVPTDNSTDIFLTHVTNNTAFVVYVKSPYTRTYLGFDLFPTCKSLLDALIADSDGYSVSMSASFMNNIPTTSLLPLTNRDLGQSIALFRTYFFADDEMLKLADQYFQQILGVACSCTSEEGYLETEVFKFKCQRPDHMAIWMAYWLVDKRRLYELAGEILGQSTYSFSNQEGMLGVTNLGSDITVNLGDVFTLQDRVSDDYNEGDQRPQAAGADNVLGDAKSFWYRLQLWLRDRFEQNYGDYSLRKNQMVPGVIKLEKDINFYSYYDNYPYTISPLTREITNSVNW